MLLLSIAPEETRVRVFDDEGISYESSEQHFLVLVRGDPELELGGLEELQGLVRSP